MTQERNVHPDLRALLMGGSPGQEGEFFEPFDYAHLIKFERPSRPDSASGRVSTSAHRYTYLTDASIDIGFDDGSKDLNGVYNGPQTYIANKVLKVSNFSEATEAKASNFTITLDGNAIGAEIGEQTMNIVATIDSMYDIEIVDKNVDPLDYGFREGDKITLTGARSGTFNIVRFRSNNVIRVKKIDTNLVEGSGFIGIRLASEEIKSILLNKNDSDYASFINREVFVYRIYEKDGVTIGAPVLLFKGIISNVSFEDDEQGIIVQWGLTSHWGDFSQVKGRITSDDFHRALDENGNPQPDSAVKTIYAYDKGFVHAETSVNLLSTYVVQVEKQNIKAKKGFFGIGAKVKVKKYLQPEDRHTDLDFQLAAKSIPVMYGVRNTVGIPVFADTLKSDSSEVYVVYALCEGEIGGIYDVYINSKSLICNNKADLDARGKQTPDNTIEVICRGRADRGDVLGGSTSITPITPQTPAVNYFDTLTAKQMVSLTFGGGASRITVPSYTAPEATSFNSDGRGIVHGESIFLTEPMDMSLDFFSGSEGQVASPLLCQIAKSNNFKIQNDYWSGTDSMEYWGPNHRLADTAYVLAKFKVKEGDTTIPELEFVLRCKGIECYNYDYSYPHDPKAIGENHNNFNIGDTVDIFSFPNSSFLNRAQIIDKWIMIRPDGNEDVRFRFDNPPNLQLVDGVPSITSFFMRDVSTTHSWSMYTWNHSVLSANVPPQPLGVSPTIVQNGDTARLTFSPNDLLVSGSEPGQPSPLYSIYSNNGKDLFNGTLMIGSISGNTTLDTVYTWKSIKDRVALV